MSSTVNSISGNYSLTCMVMNLHVLANLVRKKDILNLCM
jgi:hypothetical protein